jgi:HlyD family secretion protein
LRYTDILAPTDGIVISRQVNVGQTVAASLQAPVLFTIAQDLRAMEVHTNVAESDIGRLSAGMDASFTVDAYPGERFRGRIREIRNAPQTVQNVVTYDAVVEVANAELKLKPGMTATVTATTAERRGVLRVPNTALRFEPPVENKGASRSGAMPGMPIGMPGMGGARRRAGGERADGAAPGTVVYVLVKGKPERRDIKAGLTDGSQTEITGGNLQEGEPVIVGLESAGSSGRGGAGSR